MALAFVLLVYMVRTSLECYCPFIRYREKTQCGGASAPPHFALSTLGKSVGTVSFEYIFPDFVKIHQIIVKLYFRSKIFVDPENIAELISDKFR